MGNTTPAGEPWAKQHAWSIASRRGFSREEFEDEWAKVTADPHLLADGFNRRVLGIDPKDDWLPDPDVEGDIPEHLLDYGAPGCFVDERMSVEGCRWPD